MKKTSVFALLFTAFGLFAEDLPRFRWENFTTADGLPDNRVYSVCVDGGRVWAGTDNGLALFEHGKWKVFTPADGLAHRAVLSLALDKQTHDLWIATMGGLSRYSAGRFDTFTQLNSGLANDVVYGVAVEGDFLWVATAAGGSRLNTRTGEWSLYNERNTPMYEIWTYGVAAAPTRSTTRYGAAEFWNTTSKRTIGKTITTPMAKTKSCCTRTGAHPRNHYLVSYAGEISGPPLTSARAAMTDAVTDVTETTWRCTPAPRSPQASSRTESTSGGQQVTVTGANLASPTVKFGTSSATIVSSTATTSTP